MECTVTYPRRSPTLPISPWHKPPERAPSDTCGNSPSRSPNQALPPPPHPRLLLRDNKPPVYMAWQLVKLIPQSLCCTIECGTIIRRLTDGDVDVAARQVQLELDDPAVVIGVKNNPGSLSTRREFGRSLDQIHCPIT
jgi:hypothetical protein